MTTHLGDIADDKYSTWDAAYVLGALSDEERREYEAYLAVSESARAAVAELSALPPLLALLDPDEVAALDENTGEPPPASPQVVHSLVDEVSRRRRRSRMVTTAIGAFAAALLAVGLVIVARPGAIGLQRPESEPAAIAMEQLTDLPVDATFALTDRTWGTQIDMTCNYGTYADRNEDAQEFALVLVGQDGTRTEAATWEAQPNTSVTVGAATALPKNEIASVQVVAADTNEVILQQSL